MNFLSLIPARGGSKGIPNKNIKFLDGKPLIYYSIEVAKKAKLVNRVVVSTDSKEISAVAKKYGAEVIDRPAELASDESPTELTMIHAVVELEKSGYKPDYIVLLQPTSPLRYLDDIDNSINKILKDKADSLLSVQFNKHFLWKDVKGRFTPVNYDILDRPRRQKRNLEFLENGSIYITSFDILMKTKNRLGGRKGYYIMNEESSIEIDSEFDFWLAGMILKKYKKNKNEKSNKNWK